MMILLAETRSEFCRREIWL